jgi:hypothetical protein
VGGWGGGGGARGEMVRVGHSSQVGYGYGSGRAGRRHLPLEDGAQHEVRHDAREDRLGGLDRLRK